MIDEGGILRTVISNHHPYKAHPERRRKNLGIVLAYLFTFDHRLSVIGSALKHVTYSPHAVQVETQRSSSYIPHTQAYNKYHTFIFGASTSHSLPGFLHDGSGV